MSPVYLHHMLVHFPISFFFLAGVFALIAMFKKSDFLNKSILVVLGAGVLISIAVITTGLLSADHIVEEGEATLAVVHGHRNAAILSGILALLGLLILWWNRKKDSRGTAAQIGRIIVIAAALAVLVAGHRGSKMIHPDLTLFGSEHHHHHHHYEGEVDENHEEFENHEHADHDDHDHAIENSIEHESSEDHRVEEHHDDDDHEH